MRIAALVIIAFLAVGYFVSPALHRFYAARRYAEETRIVRAFLQAAADHDSLGMHGLTTNDASGEWTRQAEARMPGFLKSAASSLQPLEGQAQSESEAVLFSVDRPLCAEVSGTPFRMAAYFVKFKSKTTLVGIHSIPC